MNDYFGYNEPSYEVNDIDSYEFNIADLDNKYGFSDGDLFEGFADSYGGISWDENRDFLLAVIRKFVVPEIQKLTAHVITVDEFNSNHNHVRVSKIDDVYIGEVEHLWRILQGNLPKSIEVKVSDMLDFAKGDWNDIK